MATEPDQGTLKRAIGSSWAESLRPMVNTSSWVTSSWTKSFGPALDTSRWTKSFGPALDTSRWTKSFGPALDTSRWTKSFGPALDTSAWAETFRAIVDSVNWESIAATWPEPEFSDVFGDLDQWDPTDDYTDRAEAESSLERCRQAWREMGLVEQLAVLFAVGIAARLLAHMLYVAANPEATYNPTAALAESLGVGVDNAWFYALILILQNNLRSK